MSWGVATRDALQQRCSISSNAAPPGSATPISAGASAWRQQRGQSVEQRRTRFEPRAHVVRAACANMRA